MKRYLNRARPLAALLAIPLCSTVAPPAAAAEPAPTRPLAAAAAAAGEALPEAAVAQATQPTANAPSATTPAAVADGKPFFKTTKGVVAIALLAGGFGYMTYSFSNDRVKSPQR